MDKALKMKNGILGFLFMKIRKLRENRFFAQAVWKDGAPP